MKLIKTLILMMAVALMTVSAPAQSGAGTAKSATKATEKAAEKKTKAATATDTQLDINSCTAAELKDLPGIGEKYSAKIIAGRPYANKSQLVSKDIIPEATYKKIQDKIIAKQKK